MFKRILAAVALAAISVTSFAADDIYKVPTTGAVVSTKNVYQIDTGYAGGFLRLYLVGGGEQLVADQAGTVIAKILANQPEFTRVTGTNSYVNPIHAVGSNCQYGRSAVSLPNTGLQVTAADGCTMATLIYNKAK